MSGSPERSQAAQGAPSAAACASCRSRWAALTACSATAAAANKQLCQELQSRSGTCHNSMQVTEHTRMHRPHMSQPNGQAEKQQCVTPAPGSPSQHRCQRHLAARQAPVGRTQRARLPAWYGWLRNSCPAWHPWTVATAHTHTVQQQWRSAERPSIHPLTSTKRPQPAAWKHTHAVC